MKTRAYITGCAGPQLQANEAKLFEKYLPWGLILFKRNCESPDQIRQLIADFRKAVGRSDAPIFIDQEGGRVQRLGPPTWRKYPEARALGNLYNINPGLALRAARNMGRLMAQELYALNITSTCLPVLDVPQAGAHDVIGGRAYGLRPEMIIVLARAHMAGLMDGGVLPVMKHIPGHGRSMVDSHHNLPIVSATRLELENIDFIPFTGLSDCPMAMTAHVVFQSIDPDNPATLSRKIIRHVVRKVIGFQGLLMTDDLSMKALGGTHAQKAVAAYEAGVDMLLHCNGVFEEMEEIGANAIELTPKTARRAKVALKVRRKPQRFDEKQAMADLNALTETDLVTRPTT
ncbi:beta-N-acetylhexosaminidase [Aestuariivirga litoralis]|uniref:beta-N-acetylhexosaminidase n=1 Tax=Aestuariivirga litoralis TaxID=2650924 RepID=UPI0018C6FD65|nr:beta-N-acetylhexosaminidase [Aestuariivirga litoralis]MBG1231619.1 beta-N-acetylhexosaminidase [Aestuariivirga litoralis]